MQCATIRTMPVVWRCGAAVRTWPGNPQKMVTRRWRHHFVLLVPGMKRKQCRSLAGNYVEVEGRPPSAPCPHVHSVSGSVRASGHF